MNVSHVKFFDPGLAFRTNSPLAGEIMDAIYDTLSSGRLILQKEVEEFESQLAKYVGTKHAVSVANGTDAIYLVLQWLKVGPGDVVMCPSYTFRATVDSPLRLGAEVRLYDYGEKPDLEGVTIFLPAHIAGYVEPWMEETIKDCKMKGIVVVEDAAQAIGAAPVRGLAATYSFYPAKILGAPGDAGAVCTDNDALAEWLKRARNHFKGEEGPIGLNSRLDNVWAAVLSVKMKYLPEFIKRRKEIADMYQAELKGVTLPPVHDVVQDFIIESDHADELYEYLKKHGIETMKNGYPFAECIKKLPKTLAYEARSLRLPCNPDLTNEEIRYVIDTINGFSTK